MAYLTHNTSHQTTYLGPSPLRRSWTRRVHNADEGRAAGPASARPVGRHRAQYLVQRLRVVVHEVGHRHHRLQHGR